MSKILYKIIFTIFLFLIVNYSYSQVYYDDNNWEEISQDGIDFVTLGTSWDHQIITYFFNNGTADITNEQAAIRQAFDLWEDNSNLIFIQVCQAGEADIVISWVTFNHGNHHFCASDGFHCPFDGQNGILAHVVDRPPPGFFFGNSALCGDIHFDDSENWTDAVRNNANQPIDLITVAAHEIGHSLGLAHSDVEDALMWNTYEGSHRFLDEDDIDGIDELYPDTVDPPVVTGPDLLCTSGTFTLEDAPTTTVTWSVTPSYLVTPSSGSGTTADLSKNGNGNPTITFEVGCQNTVEFSYDFHTGPYSSSDYEITGPSSASCNQYVYYSIPQLEGVTSINWIWPSGWTYVSGQGTRYLALRTGTYGGVVAVGVNNTCGQSGSYDTHYTSVYGCYGPFGYNIYPNPASSELVIELTDLKTGELVSYNEFNIGQILIINNKQEIVFKKQYKGLDNRRVTVDLRNIKAGTVYVKVKVGEYEFTERVIIRK